MENIIISKEFLDWYDYYNECKEKYSSLVNDTEDKLICGKYKEIQLNVIKLRNDGFEENTKNVLLFFLWKI